MQNSINLQQAQLLVPDKKALYNACLINQFRVPELKTSICSKEYLLAVKDGRCYTPVLSAIQLRACPNPPPIHALHDMLIDVIENNFGQMSDESFPQFAELLRLLGKGKGDSKWYIDLISTLTNGRFPIFNPDYIYVKQQQFADISIVNHNGFFDYLPAATQSKGNGSILLSEKQQNAREMQKIEAQKTALKLREQKQKEKMARQKAEEDRILALYRQRKSDMLAHKQQLQDQKRMQALNKMPDVPKNSLAQSQEERKSDKNQDVNMSVPNVIGNKIQVE